MELQELVIQVDREGNVTLHVRGVKGEKCTQITRKIEETLGNVVEKTLSGEFYQERERVLNRECFIRE